MTPKVVRACVVAPLRSEGHIVLVGHRASGKTRLLPLLAQWVGWPGVDLDAVIAQSTGRPVRDWVQQDVRGFREQERHAFVRIEGRRVVSAGGGFLSHHPDLLEGQTPVLIPVTYETYRDRLMKDTSRPRLRPEVSLEEEIREVFEAREALHARVQTVSLAQFLASTLEATSP